MASRSLKHDLTGPIEGAPRLRSNNSAFDSKQQPSVFQNQRQHQHHHRSQDSADNAKGSAMCMGTIGWKIVGGLVAFGLFIVLSNGVNKSDYQSAPSFLSSSSSMYKYASTPIEDVYAKCAQEKVHPIACKVEHAANLATQLEARQSSTPEQAVHAYKRRYLRQPPAAFEKWVALALENNATIIDDYDQIEVDIDFLRQAGLVGNRLKMRMLEAKSLLPGYEFGQLSIVDGQAVVFGPDVGPLSSSTLVELLGPVQHVIPMSRSHSIGVPNRECLTRSLPLHPHPWIWLVQRGRIQVKSCGELVLPTISHPSDLGIRSSRALSTVGRS
ncbi:hypothetical protein NDA18_004605 [Ustilago nuda]|nr:hypothetical protein NDA18_004605 [Ustilago nuda]